MLSTEESLSSSGVNEEQFQSFYRALRLLLGIVKNGTRNLETGTDKDDDDTASASVVKDFSGDISSNNESAIKETVIEKNLDEEGKPNALTDVICLMKICAGLTSAKT